MDNGWIITVHKVKSHTTVDDVAARVITEYERRRLEKLDQMPIGYYKKRHIKLLSLDEKRNIIYDHLVQ